MEPLIRIRNLTNQFGTQTVHEGLDLDIYQGEVLGIVGGSGSGKSVLLRTILGLNQPLSGEICFNGQDLATMPTDELASLKRCWGVLFQRGALFSSLSVADNIQFPMREFTTLTPAECREQMLARLEMVGLERQVADKLPAELSGGMTKRVALARALALDPVLLLLDEPTSGLDPVAAEEFDQLIARLHRNLELTVVMVTHDLDSLFSVCSRVAMLVDKRVVDGTLQALLENPHPQIQHYFGGRRARAIIRGSGWNATPTTS